MSGFRALLMLVAGCYVEVPSESPAGPGEGSSIDTAEALDLSTTPPPAPPLVQAGLVEWERGNCDQELVEVPVGALVQAMTCDDDPSYGSSLCRAIPERVVVVLEADSWWAYVTGCVTDDRIVLSWVSVGG